MKILIADDSKTTLTLLANALAEMGHEIDAVSSGRQAIESFKRERPDLLILDVIMEDIDGFECAREIRKIDPDEWIPIIFLSSTVDDESISKGIDAGGDDYLTKPFSKITLAAKIKAMQRISDMRKKLYETTQKLYLQSSTDALTGVYNRFQFDISLKEIMDGADNHQSLLALLFIDIDNFKSINDNFGHKVGDQLLIEVANRLKSVIRSNAFLARIGGDEFAIILGDIPNIEAAGQLGQKIITEITKPYELSSHTVHSSVSIGIASYSNSNITPENLLQNADIAMYHAKSLGRNNYQYYTEELYSKYKKQISIEQNLKTALQKKEFHLTYEPIFNLLTNELMAIEVIVNWSHPTLGSIPPSIFIPIAEQIGVMTALGEWILQTACYQCQEWKLKDYKNVKLAINITSRQILQKDFIKSISYVLHEAELPAKILRLELNETTIMSNENSIIKDTLKELHEMGCNIAIDDFGTGYSSLIKLKNLPISTLKIEKNFVHDILRNPNSKVIVSCMIALAKNLNINITAQGIENKKQLDLLIAEGCDHGQGSYLKEPLDAESMGKLLLQIKKMKERSAS